MIIDGKAVAERIRKEIAAEVEQMVQQHNLRPGLATVLVGTDPASQTYVSMKRKACAEAGIESFGHELSADSSQDYVLGVVRELNADPRVHGILVQLPLPKHIDEEAILNAISIQKDVDGFHPLNIGRLSMKGRDPLFMPCTPLGCMVLLEEVGAKFDGANAVVLGRSNIVGLPAAMMLLKRNATVSIVHSRSKDPAAMCREADILIAAVGRPHMVKGDWIKPGALVIDVGVNRIDDPSRKSGYRLVGDVDYEAAKDVAGAITPVPGGVGPMTIAMLLQNTLRAAKMTLPVNA
ncbi:MAG: bifunctional methylenetetrahydrofolate dehydrogenase/methenyltetrahydrofolate cyclohydrolase FolD [Anaerolineales bacterium]|nr:bifunctional methylenetetrahydrofolate dehydrogenase/methenyltetrahydrofolate cyclohydrolase FolD [Anaerolineales bacterium]